MDENDERSGSWLDAGTYEISYVDDKNVSVPMPRPGPFPMPQRTLYREILCARAGFFTARNDSKGTTPDLLLWLIR